MSTTAMTTTLNLDHDTDRSAHTPAPWRRPATAVPTTEDPGWPWPWADAQAWPWPAQVGQCRTADAAIGFMWSWRRNPAAADRALGTARVAAADAGGRLVGLLRRADAPASGAHTVQALVDRLVARLGRHVEVASGNTVRQLPCWSAERTWVDGWDPDGMSAAVESAVRLFLDVTAQRGGLDAVEWSGGLTLDLAHLAAIALGDVLLLGHDIARALDTPWPIAAADARIVLTGWVPVLPASAWPGEAWGAVEVRLGEGAGFVLRLTRGGLLVETACWGPTQCVVAAEPQAFLLMLGGRLDRVTASSLGLLAVSGERPELAWQLPTLFARP